MSVPIPAPADPRRVFRFGVFEVDARALELRKQGRPLRIQQQPLNILVLLLERAGEVVTREELRRALWPADVYVDFDRGLNKAFVKLRDALDDSATSPRFIETIPRVGYRFIAPVETSSEAPPLAGAIISETTSRRPPRRVLFATLVLVALALLVAGAWFYSSSQSQAQIRSLAVLPLENLSADPAQDYFAEGMTDELITELAQIGSLRIISRTSVIHYKSTRKTVPEIARELNVDAVLEGSVARSGNRVRITAQLIEARTDKHLWADRYEGELRDVLAMQDAVARDVVDKIRLRLSSQQEARLNRSRQVNPVAHEAYLKGLYYWNKRSKDGLEKAIAFFNQAIAADPNYALPYAGIAEAYIPLTYFGEVRGTEARSRVMTALTKALELDDSLAEAHTALGSAKSFYDYDWNGAEKEFRRAISLNPNYATGRQWYAQLLGSEGRTTEALAEGRRALALDPLSLAINAGWGHRLYRARRFNEAATFLNRVALDLDPNYPMTHWTLGFVYIQQKKFALAIAELEKAKAAFEGNALIEGTLGCAAAASGDRQRAEAVLGHLTSEAKTRYIDPYALAMVFAGLQDNGRAIAWLQRASDDRDGFVTFVNNEPMLDGMRADPRFLALVAKMGLQPPAH